VEDFEPPLVTGIDLGTSNIQVIVLDRQGAPVTARFKWDEVVRDGVVVDFVAAREKLRSMIDSIENSFPNDIDLKYASVGYPPGTESWVETNVVEDTGLEVVKEIAEPSAAATALGIEQGAIVDIGGGTTGISILERGQITYSGDEPTGGDHLSLVLSGNRGLSFEEAEEYKRTTPLDEYAGIVQPVIQKMASIVEDQLRPYSFVDTVHFVGGTVIPEGFEQMLSEELPYKVVKPDDPIRVTPIGIATEGSMAIRPSPERMATDEKEL